MPNQFLNPAKNNPLRDPHRSQFYTPTVKILDSNDPTALQIAINFFITSDLTDPNYQYFIRDIQYSSTQLKNNKIKYSALVWYEKWES